MFCSIVVYFEFRWSRRTDDIIAQIIGMLLYGFYARYYWIQAMITTPFVFRSIRSTVCICTYLSPAFFCVGPRSISRICINYRVRATSCKDTSNLESSSHKNVFGNCERRFVHWWGVVDPTFKLLTFVHSTPYLNISGRSPCRIVVSTDHSKSSPHFHTTHVVEQFYFTDRHMRNSEISTSQRLC